jgi:hypothetical protein
MDGLSAANISAKRYPTWIPEDRHAAIRVGEAEAPPKSVVRFHPVNVVWVCRYDRFRRMKRDLSESATRTGQYQDDGGD